MSENNNNGKKNFFKRLSGFKKFLVIYASVLVVIIAVALVLLYGLLKDYEAGRPANTMDKLVSHIEAGNVGKWIKDAGILGEFETEDIVSDYFKDTFADKEVSYKKKAGEYTENNPVYILYASYHQHYQTYSVFPAVTALESDSAVCCPCYHSLQAVTALLAVLPAYSQP